MTQDYPRAQDMPGPGSPRGRACSRTRCSSRPSTTTTSPSGMPRMLVNEGLPLYVVSRLEERFDLATMTVGILGMAFKARVGRHPVEPVATSSSASCASRPKRVLCTDPYVVSDPTSCSLDEVLAAADLLDRRDAPRRVPRTRHRQAGRGRVEPARPRSARVTSPPRVSVVIPAYNEGDGDRPGPRPHVRGRHARLRGARRRRLRRTTRRSRRSRSTRRAPAPTPRRRATPTAAVPRNAIRYGIDAAAAPVVVVTMADGCDDPRRSTTSTSSSSAASWSQRRRDTCRAASRSAGPCSRASCRRRAGRSLHLLARVGTRDATNSFKAYSTRVRREVGIDSRRRLRDRPRARRPRRAGCGCRWPRSPRSGWTGTRASPTSRWPSGSRSTCAGTASRSVRALTRLRAGSLATTPVTGFQQSKRVTHEEGPGHRIGRVHRRLRRRGAARRGYARRRHRQLLQVRQGDASPTTTTPTTSSSTATPGTWSS